MIVDRRAVVDAVFAGTRAGHIDVSGIDDCDLDGALDLQLGVLERWVEAGEELGGWKVGLTSGAARDAMGESFRPFGYILKSRIIASGTPIPVADLSKCFVEPELCFTIGGRIPDDLDEQTIRAAVRAVAPAFEVAERRLPAGAEPQLKLVDDLLHWGIVVGREHPLDVDVTDLTVELRCGEDLVSTGHSGTGIDDPYVSLARLVARLRAHGRDLQPGHRVITGSVTKAQAVDGPSEWSARFGALGDVTALFV